VNLQPEFLDNGSQRRGRWLLPMSLIEDQSNAFLLLSPERASVNDRQTDSYEQEDRVFHARLHNSSILLAI
jgi:hypothetical protein